MSADPAHDTPTTAVAPAGTSERHIALLGGWRREGSAPAPERALKIAPVGGANLDFGRSAFPAKGTTVTSWGIVGGVDITVPAGTRVELKGFNLIGRRRVEVTPGDGPRLTVRAWAFVGGVHVHSA